MTIVVSKKNAQKKENSGIVLSNPNLHRYGAWGIVQDVYSVDHSADVLIDAGVLLYHVPVSSSEWVVSADEYTSGKRDLPPRGARVFIMMPTGNFDGCFVLCSGFVPMDKAQKEAFLSENKEKIRKHVTPANWKKENHYATGTIEIISPDGKTSLKIDYGTEDDPKDTPELHLNIFDQIKCDIVTDDNVNLCAFDELNIEHKKGDSAKITIFDTDVIIKNGEIAIKSGGKIYLGGSADNICSLFLALIDELIAFQTMGPPPQHVTHPQTITKLNTFKEKIKALFKENA